MANLKEIRVRISSVVSTRQITSAMKMVSAAKLKKAQDSIVQLRPYALKLNEILKNISSSLDSGDDNIYGKERPIKNVLIVLITSNRGMCGAFNSNAIKTALGVAHSNYDSQLKQGRLNFICIGKKGNDFLRIKHYPILQSFNHVLDKPTFDKVIPVANEIMQLFVSGQYDKVILVYNKFKNAAVQQLVDEQFLPVPKQVDDDDKKGMKSDYIFEPSKEFIMKDLIPKSLKVEFFKAILDSYASEHGARMTAMHKATDNATEMIKQLTLNYNKARQAAITGEILEIVGGAEALKG
jgi:F-type H+-transporting ATPase subunit gamma